MIKKIVLLLVISMMLGCVTVELPAEQDSDPVVQPQEPVETIPLEPVDEVEPEELEGCQSDAQPEDVQTVKIESVEFTQEGFTVKFYPMDKDMTEIIPTEGNAAIILYSTETNTNSVNGLARSKEIFRKGFYIDPEKLMDDCSPPTLEVKFSEYKDSTKFKYNVEEGDKGSLRLDYTRTGTSGDSIYADYWPEEDESFLK